MVISYIGSHTGKRYCSFKSNILVHLNYLQTRLRKRSAMEIEEKLINEEMEENDEDCMQDGGGDETFFDPVGPGILCWKGV